MRNRRLPLLAGATAAAALVALAAFVAVTRAEPASGVTPTILARGTYDSFNVRSDPQGTIDGFRAHSIAPMDIIVRQHDYAVGSTTGWHSHPGPVFITVTKGTLTYYERDDPTCSPHVVTAGNGFVDDGVGHVVRNESGQPAQDISVITAPVGGAFRTNLDAPGPYCSF
jgi:quercetin dioxygenase-like cupin family protein